MNAYVGLGISTGLHTATAYVLANVLRYSFIATLVIYAIVSAIGSVALTSAGVSIGMTSTTYSIVAGIVGLIPSIIIGRTYGLTSGLLFYFIPFLIALAVVAIAALLMKKGESAKTH